MYITVSTRPGISHAVSALSRFSNNPDKAHRYVTNRVLRCLQRISQYDSVYRQWSGTLSGYVDADWGGDRVSYTGFVFELRGAAIPWEDRKQCSVALSSTEAEYMALTEAAKEPVFLKVLDGTRCFKIECWSHHSVLWQPRSSEIDEERNFIFTEQTHWGSTPLSSGNLRKRGNQHQMSTYEWNDCWYAPESLW